MFDRFEQYFTYDKELSISDDTRSSFRHSSVELEELLRKFGGLSFNRALFRIVAPSSLGDWNDLIARTFPERQSKLVCFSYDWLGRVYAFESTGAGASRGQVVMCEPGTGEVTESGIDIIGFFDDLLVADEAVCLAGDYYSQWLANGGAIPKYGECIGYKIPLFFGGSDTIENLELSDIEVYWHISSQLIVKVRGLPPGTRIGRVTIGN